MAAKVGSSGNSKRLQPSFLRRGGTDKRDQVLDGRVDRTGFQIIAKPRNSSRKIKPLNFVGRGISKSREETARLQISGHLLIGHSRGQGQIEPGKPCAS